MSLRRSVGLVVVSVGWVWISQTSLRSLVDSAEQILRDGIDRGHRHGRRFPEQSFTEPQEFVDRLGLVDVRQPLAAPPQRHLTRIDVESLGELTLGHIPRPERLLQRVAKSLPSLGLTDHEREAMPRQP
jgi:hypothetical protein